VDWAKVRKLSYLTENALFSKTEKGSSETSSGPQNKFGYSYFAKKSQKNVRVRPNLAQSLIFMKLAKMAILDRKLKNQKFLFSQNLR